MNTILTFWFFALGAAVGSFLNVCIYRLPRDKSVNDPPRSFCPSCGHQLSWFDNIPLVSFFLLGRCCRHCGLLISWRYVLVETLTACLFALLYIRCNTWEGARWGVLMAYCVLIAALIASTFIDAEFFIIPDIITLPLALAGILWCGFFPELQTAPAFGEQAHISRGLAMYGRQANLGGFISAAISVAISGGVVYGLRAIGTLIFKREAMGIGDVKLMMMVGALLGWKLAICAFFIAPFFGVMFGIRQLITRKQSEMPYGPHLAAATILVMFFQDAVLPRFENYARAMAQLFQMIAGR
ncbi:MAG TPA: prepilin peptidase [Candidatus Brocadiia bacterium]|nr:prepilin peptidase [Candidatus Brocadiia bacterium]